MYSVYDDVLYIFVKKMFSLIKDRTIPYDEKCWFGLNIFYFNKKKDLAQHKCD